MKAVGQVARGDYFRGELNECLEEEARVGGTSPNAARIGA
jgi:hypothetical protein